MRGFEVRRFRGRAGDEFAILIDRDRGPAFWPNVYVTSEYAKRRASVNTSLKVLRSIGMARLWAEKLGRDFDQELRAGGFLSLQDAEALVDFLRLTAEAQSEFKTLAPQTEPAVSVVPLERLLPKRKSLAQEAQVAAPQEVASRVRWVAAYVKWHLSHRLGDLDRRQLDSSNLAELGQDVVARLQELAPRVSGSHDDDVALEGVPTHILNAIEEALLSPGYDNPFASEFTRARNYILWRLLLDTGARREEVQQAKVGDIDYATRYFDIRVSKTRARRVPISSVAATAFDEFVMGHWSRLPLEARRRGYLFTDKHGRHLSLRAINRVFERIRKKVDGVPDFMAPHTVRRSWNDNFSARVDALPPEKRLSEKQEIEIRNRLQGWSGSSSMGHRYAKRHIRRSADKIAQELADTLLCGSREDSNQ